MIDIKLEETQTLTLEMVIDGDVKRDDTQLRFSILAEGIRYSFDSIKRSSGVFDIQFPSLLGKITEGEYPAEVEIIVDGKYFSPLKETVRFTKELKPTVKLSESSAPEPKFAVNTIKILESVPVITTVKDMLSAASNNSGEIDTSLALKCINSMVQGKALTESAFRIQTDRVLSEAEVIAAVRILKSYGSDIEGEMPNIIGLVNLSERATEEIGKLLSEKGLSAKKIQQLGL